MPCHFMTLSAPPHGSVVVEHVRELGEADLDAAAWIFHAGFSNSQWGKSFDLGDAKTTVQGMLSAARRQPTNHRVFVARLDGRVVGLAQGYLVPNRISSVNARRPYRFETVAVHPDFMKRGIGRALDAAREAHARELKADAFVSWTRSPERVASLRRRGFQLLPDWIDKPFSENGHEFYKRV